MKSIRTKQLAQTITLGALALALLAPDVADAHGGRSRRRHESRAELRQAMRGIEQLGNQLSAAREEGKLTDAQYNDLKAQAKTLREKTRRAYRDGRLSSREDTRLTDRLKRLRMDYAEATNVRLPEQANDQAAAAVANVQRGGRAPASIPAAASDPAVAGAEASNANSAQ